MSIGPGVVEQAATAAPAALAGLSDAEATARLRSDGYNELPHPPRRTPLVIMIDAGREPMFQLLLAAAVIYLLLGSLGEAAMLGASAIVTIGIAIVQESRTERVLEALRDLTSPRALVIRGGERQRIPGREVVRGDLVVLAEGDRVPADALLRRATDLQADESLLTGESVPVRKVAASGAPQAARPGGDDLPFAYAGSVIVRGHGIGEVQATGAGSEIGRIGTALGASEPAATPLRAQTRRLVRVFAVIGGAVSILAVLLYGILRGGWLEAFLAGITLAMSMLPEEFPLVITVFLVMGAWRIAQQRVLTRRAATIEALGAATVLCTDKTGTLTMNRMAVAELRVGGTAWRPGDADLPEAVHELVEFAILASARDPFDPMERAFHDLGASRLAGTEHLHHDWALVRSYGLRPGLLAMSQAWKPTDRDEHVVAAKGAVEAIAALCRREGAELAGIRVAADRMAAAGMRVLGVARASWSRDAWPDSQTDFAFRFVGLVGLSDPLRPSARAAVEQCRSAGIKVVMVTGDYPATARAIAAAAGLDAAAGLVAGNDMRDMTDDELRRRVGNTIVFARVMPEQKLRIVDALKANGEIVAMTGDGVNDAPSLRSAHIGIAMGGRGTDVAREAAALVLLDDDFASIVKAVRLGRRIYDNLRKAMTYILAVHVPIAGLSLIPLVLGWPLVFTPVHIAFLELVIDPVCSIVFEAEREEPDVMGRPPRSSAEPLLSWRLIGWSLFQGACVLVLVATIFVAALARDLPEAEARALAFTTLVLANFGMILLDRSASASLAQAVLRPNATLWGVFAATLLLLGLAIYLPPVDALFRFAPMPASELAFALAAAAALLAALEVAKSALHPRRRARPAPS